VESVKNEARNISIRELDPKDAKWVSLNVIEYEDQEGTRRKWEVASRKTTPSLGIDGVDIIPLLRSKTDGEPIATIIIEQYRPPTKSITIEFPAGLADKGETPEMTAIRELEEETGFKASSVFGSSPLLWSDPGMTTATMKTVILDVPVASIHDDMPPQQLDAGEHIVRRIVPLDELKQVISVYAEHGAAIDAKLSHFADGWDLFKRLCTPMLTGH